MTSVPWKVRAKTASRPTNPDPIKMQAGDLLEIAGEEDEGWIWCRNRAGKESWVPLSYLSAEDEGKTRTEKGGGYGSLRLSISTKRNRLSGLHTSGTRSRERLILVRKPLPSPAGWGTIISLRIAWVRQVQFQGVDTGKLRGEAF